MSRFELQCDYHQLADIERSVKRASGIICQRQFLQYIVLLLEIPLSQVPIFKKELSNLSQGQLVLTPA